MKEIMKRFVFIVLISLSMPAMAQDVKPKLVVGIVVDQMRQDFIYRYWDNYSDRGFKRMISNGYMLKNFHYNYAQTVTGAGHASIYTGTTPTYHGVIGNSWFDKDSGKYVNCVGDDSVATVGADN